MRDEDHRHPVGDEALEDLEQLDRLLRGQHRRRLVEDQDVGTAIERLQDLDALLLPDCDRLHLRVRVDVELELVGELAHAALCGGGVEEHAVPARLRGEDDVLGDGHHRDEHEMLVHHSDPGCDRAVRRGEVGRCAVEQDLPVVRPVEAVEDVHERRLAGAVLAEERVHLAPAQVEIDPVVRENTGEALRDAAQLEDGRIGVSHSRRRFYGETKRAGTRARPLRGTTLPT